jgi:hypothetical protein
MQDSLNDIDQKRNTLIGSTGRPHHGQCHVMASRLSLIGDVYTSQSNLADPEVCIKSKKLIFLIHHIWYLKSEF